MKARTLLWTAGLCLSLGCATQAVIADLEGDKVVVQQSLTTPMEEVLASARSGCRIHGKIARGPISHVCADGYCMTKRHLFACIEGPDQAGTSGSAAR